MYKNEATSEQACRQGNFVVTLCSVGNPDHGQSPFSSLPGVASRSSAEKTLIDASRTCRAYIDANNLGSGNWSGGDVFEDGVKVARISYNGRIWMEKAPSRDLVNYLVQPAPWMPAGHRFKLVKTRVDIAFDGAIIETDVGLAIPFEAEYFKSRKAAQTRRQELLQASSERVGGCHSFFGISDSDVSEWLHEEGKLIGIENHEAWFSCLSKVEQSQFRVAYFLANQEKKNG